MRALALLCCLFGVARAHDTGAAKATLSVGADGAVTATLGMARVDAAELLGLIDDTGLDARMAEIGAGLERWLTLSTSAPCPWRGVAARPAGVRGIEVQATAACPPGPTLTIRWAAASLTPLKLELTAGVTRVDGQTELLRLDREAPTATVNLAGAGHDANFFALGVEHMLTGWDHLAFLLALILSCARLRRLLAIVTSFTVAHSVTLALGTTGVITLAARVVEPIIAASIAVAAATALIRLWRGTLRWPGRDGPLGAPAIELGICFGFGLVHGLGFAGLLAELAPNLEGVFVPLLTFNLGVEVGQIGAVLVAFPLLVWVGRTRAARSVFGALLTGLVALGAGVAIERALG